MIYNIPKGDVSMDSEYIRQRITKLRIAKKTSELQMSRDLGLSDGYIHHIASGKALPSMGVFLEICDYFGITPEYFFNKRVSQPLLIQQINLQLEDLDDEDLLFVSSLINKIKR